MHKIILVGKVKKADLRYTQQGKAVFNVSVADFSKDKNEVWHGGNFKMAWWAEAAESAAKYLNEGEVYWFEGQVDKVETFELSSGGIGTAIVLNFPQWRFVGSKQTNDSGIPEIEGGVVTDISDGASE